MITQFQPMTAPYRMAQGYANTCGISLLLAAAVVNKGFRELLLANPEQALDSGYYGREFPLDAEERELVLSIRAESLSDFALQIVSYRDAVRDGCSGSWAPANQPAMVFDAE